MPAAPLQPYFQSDWIPNQDGVAIPQTPEQYEGIPQGYSYVDPADGSVKWKGGHPLNTGKSVWQPFNARDGTSMEVNEVTGDTRQIGPDAEDPELKRQLSQDSRSVMLGQTALDRLNNALAGVKAQHTIAAQPAIPASRAHFLGIPLWMKDNAVPATDAHVNASDPDVEKAQAEYDAESKTLQDSRDAEKADELSAAEQLSQGARQALPEIQDLPEGESPASLGYGATYSQNGHVLMNTDPTKPKPNADWGTLLDNVKGQTHPADISQQPLSPTAKTTPAPTATNPKTRQKIIFNNGKWQPVQQPATAPLSPATLLRSNLYDLPTDAANTTNQQPATAPAAAAISQNAPQDSSSWTSLLPWSKPADEQATDTMRANVIELNELKSHMPTLQKVQPLLVADALKRIQELQTLTGQQ